jgi:hypothetical protein
MRTANHGIPRLPRKLKCGHCGAPAHHQGAIGPVCCKCLQLEFDHCANVFTPLWDRYVSDRRPVLPEKTADPTSPSAPASK